jgi:hypothetical protein
MLDTVGCRCRCRLCHKPPRDAQVFGHLLKLPMQFEGHRSLRHGHDLGVDALPSIVNPRLTGPGLHPACLTTLGAAVCRCRCRWRPCLDGLWILVAGWPMVPLLLSPGMMMVAFLACSGAAKRLVRR